LDLIRGLEANHGTVDKAPLFRRAFAKRRPQGFVIFEPFCANPFRPMVEKFCTEDRKDHKDVEPQPNRPPHEHT